MFAWLRALRTGREPFEAAASIKIQSIALGRHHKCDQQKAVDIVWKRPSSHLGFAAL